MTGEDSAPSRRGFLAGAALAAVSGCIGANEDTTPAGETTPTRTTPTATATDARSTTPGPPFAQFTDLERWTAGGGEVLLDDESPLVGDRTIRISCEPSDKRALATYRPPQPLDLSDRYPSLAYRYGPSAEGGRFVVWLLAPNTDNRLAYERVAEPGNGWIETPLSTPDEVVGDPDLTDVRGLTAFEYTGGGDSVRIWLDDVRLHPRPERSAVLFTFDDGHRSVAETARPIMEEHGHAGAIAVIPGREDRESRCSLDQLSGLQDAGWEVVSHPQRPEPLPTVDAAEQEAAIAESKTWLEDHGFERGARYFVYPYGRWDRTTADLVDEYHDVGFGGRGVTTWSPRMPTLTNRIKGDDADVVAGYLDRLSTYGGVMALMYHAVGAGSKWISEGDFRDVVAAVADSDAEVLSVSEWAEAGRPG